MSCTSNPELDFSQLIDKYSTEYPEATFSVVAISLDDPTVLQHQSSRVFHAASLMKVPVMIEIYKQAKAGKFALSDSIDVINEFRSIVDQSSYSMSLGDDSDDKIYSSIGKKMTIADLTEKMITVSSNLSTNILIEMVGAENVQNTIEALGTKNMKVLRGVEDLVAFKKGLNNTVTATDMAVILRALALNEAVSPEDDAAMIEVLKGQEFDEMIPKYLGDDSVVAHKTGQITEIHHDAAIVYPSNGPPFVLVVLIEGLKTDSESAELGAKIAEGVAKILG